MIRTQPNPGAVADLITRLAGATDVPSIARLTAHLLRECGIHGIQTVGYELSRLAVTAGIEGQPINPKIFT